MISAAEENIFDKIEHFIKKKKKTKWKQKTLTKLRMEEHFTTPSRISRENLEQTAYLIIEYLTLFS